MKGRTRKDLGYRGILAVVLISFSAASCGQGGPDEKLPVRNKIPDELTAVRVGVAELISVYGEAQINSEKPFKANLVDGAWIIVGTMEAGLKGEEVKGGVAEIRLSKESGQVPQVTHGE